MGTYTELFIRAEIDAELFSILSTQKEVGYSSMPVEFAKKICEGKSWYAPHAYHFELALVENGPGQVYFFSLRSSLKNYDDEIEKFLTWIRPHLKMEENDLLGFTHVEDVAPRFIYV